MNEFEENEILELGYIKSKDIYGLILNGEEVNLNKCYIEEFDWEKCVEGLNSEEKKKLEIIDFRASNAFFDNEVNFSGAKFNNSVVDYSLTIFGNCGLAL